MSDSFIHRSKYPDVVIPENISVHKLLFDACDERPNVELVVDGPTGRSYTGAQVKAIAHKFAKGLASLGFKKGDCFSIISPNVPEFVIMVLGCSLLGGVCSPINPLYTAGEVHKQLVDCHASIIVTVAPFLEKVQEASKDTNIKHVVVLGEAEGVPTFASLLQNDGVVPEVPIDTKNDLFALPYSSGTTGFPKGVMLTHYNIVANLHQFNHPDFLDFSEKDTIIGVLPFFHIYGLVVFSLAGLLKGAKVVAVPKFEPVEFLTMIQKLKVTILLLVPPLVLFLAKHPVVDKFDLSSVRQIVCGAAPLGKETTIAVAERLKITDVRQGYGMTELSPVTHFNSSSGSKHGSIGVLLFNTQCKIVDVETKAAVGPKVDGELCIRGPQVMKGYLNNPQATADTIDNDGWLHTGDIGHYDEDGYFFVVDRLKELIKYKGFQVPPAELEAILVSHPAVAEAAVIGLPDEEAGELPKAFVAKKPGVEVTDAELIKFVDDQVAPHKKLRGGLEFVNEIPKSASGKILRRLLKK